MVFLDLLFICIFVFFFIKLISTFSSLKYYDTNNIIETIATIVIIVLNYTGTFILLYVLYFICKGWVYYITYMGLN